MTLLQKELEERPTAERALRALGKAVGLSRSTIFRHLHAPSSASSTNNDVELRGQIQSIALEMRSYGYRPITEELHRRGVKANHKRVLCLLREDNLLCLRRQVFVRTTDSNHSLPVYSNLARGLALSNINQLWVADITYIRLRREFVYLAVILDAYSRRCIGWALSRHIDTQLTLKALRLALQTRTVPPGLIHHSDRGVQYASADYVALLQEHKIQISMSRTGNPYDNAKAERFMRTLKYEEIYLNDYETLAEVLASVQHFIEAVYNRKRLHSAIGYLPPAEFEASLSPPLLS
ncbi:MAG: transposase [Cyanobacteria bacterium 13_1_40CM_2_61_4]|nr:MAG: transposase [Cyanobacteria bacterium 13_1_40CM_2_61_4]